MHFDDFSAYTAGFRIPAHVIANLERLGHGSSSSAAYRRMSALGL
jgi:hypothetical protein